MKIGTLGKTITALIISYSLYMAADAIVGNYRLEKELDALRIETAEAIPLEGIAIKTHTTIKREEAPATVKQSLTVQTKETTEESQIAPVQFIAHEEIPLAAEIQEHIEIECERLEVDAAYIYALIESESSFRTGLLIEDGGGHSAGLCQINSVNWPDMRDKGLDPMNELDNITYCISLVKSYVDKYPTIDHVTTCYKAGEGGAKRLGYYLSTCDVINERTEYFKNILEEKHGED
jgi:hypothetical protein